MHQNSPGKDLSQLNSTSKKAKMYKQFKLATSQSVRIGAAATLLTGSAISAIALRTAAARTNNMLTNNLVVQEALANYNRKPNAGSPLEPIPQFLVNTYTTNAQVDPAIATDSTGDFVVVWQSDGSSDGDTNGQSIQGQRFHSDGTPKGAQFQVNTYTNNNQVFPDVAMDNDGDFVVVWQSNGSPDNDTDYSIQGQLFKNTGAKQGEQFQVNTHITSNQVVPAVAMDSDGDFAVVWASYGNSGTDPDGSSIQAQLYNSDGSTNDGQFEVNSIITGYQTAPAIAMDSNGNFVVTWMSKSATWNIKAQKFNNSGGLIGGELLVNNYTSNDQKFPSVAMDSDGDLVISWASNGSPGNDLDYSIQARRYHNDGNSDGNQFQVNTYTTNTQTRPTVAMDSDGDFVVVWQSKGSNYGDLSLYSIQAQRYNSSKVAQGSQFQVNSIATNDQSQPAATIRTENEFVITWSSNDLVLDGDASGIHAMLPSLYDPVVNAHKIDRQDNPVIAMDDQGNFVVIWRSKSSPENDSSNTSIQGQLYDKDGNPIAGQFQVNTYTTSLQEQPAVAMDSDGDFVVIWQSDGSNYGDNDSFSIQGQRYDKNGNPQDIQFQVNNITAGQQSEPVVAMDSAGNFVVVWDSQSTSGSDTEDKSIAARLFSSDGTPQGGQFQVNTTTYDRQSIPSVAMDDDGDFVVAWQSNASYGEDTDPYRIKGQRFNNIGNEQGPEFQINQFNPAHQQNPSVAMDSDGDFVVVWYSLGSNYGDNDGYSIQGARFNNSGVKQGSQFQVNTITEGGQYSPAVAMDNDGDFIVVWYNSGSALVYTDESSIQAQQFNRDASIKEDQFRVNIYTTLSQSQPTVAMDHDGDLVIAWQSSEAFQDLDESSIQMRLMKSQKTIYLPVVIR